ncbi:MAG: sigma-54 dependent transcriptional regulator [Thermodesulfovibrionales bacterium]|nr:sigma-54 dependent transcriptional regulator [Thermodesulfovibrionales bacterium]
MKQIILIVEDKESMSQMLREALEAEGYGTLLAKDGAEGIRTIKEERLDLVLTDLKLPKKDGMEILGAVREENPLTPVIIMTAYGSIETAVKAIKEGAFDFITKPFDIDHLLVLIKRAIENQRLITENILIKEEFSSRLGLPRIIGKSPKIQEVARNIQKVAQTKATVLITGESGTGKELFARAIHYISPRKDYPFVPINCAAIPAGLLESELFGHEKGSFTGADSRRLGKFELAQKGTIFFDEIGEIDTGLQAKLLRAIQEGEIERLGGTKPLKTDVRVVAASNKDLEAAVIQKTFREDLYYRLNVFPIRIPALRERKEDIPLLVEYFIKKYSVDLKTDEKEVSADAMRLMTEYGWKGNVRELENTIERAIILCEGKTVTPEHISLNLSLQPKKGHTSGSLEDTAKEAQRAAEEKRIKETLETTGGNKSRAAEMLKVSYKTLLTKIKDYGID